MKMTDEEQIVEVQEVEIEAIPIQIKEEDCDDDDDYGEDGKHRVYSDDDLLCRDTRSSASLARPLKRYRTAILYLIAFVICS